MAGWKRYESVSWINFWALTSRQTRIQNVFANEHRDYEVSKFVLNSRCATRWWRRGGLTDPKSAKAVVCRCSTNKVFLKISQNLDENACTGVSFLKKLQACNFIKKETPTQVFFCKFCKIFKSTFFHRTPPVAASESGRKICALILTLKYWKGSPAANRNPLEMHF